MAGGAETGRRRWRGDDNAETMTRKSHERGAGAQGCDGTSSPARAALSPAEESGAAQRKNAPLESQQKFPAEPLNHADRCQSNRREASGTLGHFRDTFEVNDASKHPGPVEQGLSARAQVLEPRE